jgi:hypothetical protein
VKGGNHRIPACLVDQSRASLRINTTALQVEYLGNNNNTSSRNNYNIVFVAGDTGGNRTESKLYDMVIIASPLTPDKSKLILKNLPPLPPAVVNGRYHHTYTYLIHGTINVTRLGGEEGDPAFPSDHFFIDPTERIASLSRLVPVDFDPETETASELPEVYKMFSRELLPRESIEEFFTEIRSLQTVDWLAYPHYPSNKE